MCVNSCKDRIDYLLVKREFGGTEMCPEEITPGESKEIEKVEMRVEVRKLLSEMLANVKATDVKMREIVKRAECPSDLKEMLTKFINEYPSTRDRANLIKWSVTSMGGKFDENLLSLAASTELIHLAMIFTDNLFDKTGTCGRLKEPWKMYSEPDTYIATELLMSIALENLVNSFKSHKNLDKIILKMTKAIKENYIAEFIDLQLQKCKTATYSEYIEMARKLEGKPLRCAIESALYLAGVDEEEIKILGEYGEILGTMLKIRNDILDIDPDSSKEAIGKEVGEDINPDDIYKSKKTLPILYFLWTMKDEEIKRIDGKGKKVMIMHKIKEKGCLDKCKLELTSYWSKALQKLDGLPPSEGKGWLENFGGFVAYVFSLR